MVESGRAAERYQSVVPLSEIDLAESLALYCHQSVKLPTLFVLAADGEQATGMMLQAMPERKQGSGYWKRMVEGLQGLDVARMSQVRDEVLLTALFLMNGFAQCAPRRFSADAGCVDAWESSRTLPWSLT